MEVRYRLLNVPGLRSMRADDRAPCTIVVWNDTDETIIACVLLTSLDRRIYSNLKLLPGGGVIPNGNEIPPRGSRTLCADSIFRTPVAVSLDLVVYESGRVTGPDEGETIHALRAQIEVEKELALAVRHEFDAGKSLGEVTGLLIRNAGPVQSPDPGKLSFEYWRAFFTAHVSNFFLYRARSSRNDLVETVDEILQRPAIVLHR